MIAILHRAFHPTRRRTLRGLGVSILLLLFMTLAVKSAFAAEITVNTTADTIASDGVCSLREAIQAANEDNAVGGCTAGADADRIVFAIPGDGPHVISPTLALPFISTPLTIDGYSQAGAKANTSPAPAALSTILKIVLDGTLIDGANGGLVITGGDSTIRGLVIRNFFDGIIITTNGNNVIAGNFIGTNVSGTVAAGNKGNGIVIESENNQVGYEFVSTPADRNLIAGNLANGVSIAGAAATFNQVNGNLIGTNISGTVALGNSNSGIRIIDEATNTTVRDNVLSANGEWGLHIENGATDTTVASNFIGTNAQDDALGNGAGGILARNSGPQTIGGLYTEEGCCQGNTIAYNDGNGITIRADINVSLEKGIISNRIYSNTLLGIDLRDDGVTPNDPGDLDGENDANRLQNYPVLSSAHVISDNITITGTLNTITNTDYTIEFFANDVCDPSGFGEGQRVVGRQSFTTDAEGNVAFTVTFTQTTAAQMGNSITATASDINGNTSEFSRCIVATGEDEETPQLTLALPYIIYEEPEE